MKKTLKNVANMFHLWHPYNERDIGLFYWEMMKNKEKNRFVCETGVRSNNII